jgi:hypothetical protein
MYKEIKSRNIGETSRFDGAVTASSSYSGEECTQDEAKGVVTVGDG